MLDLRARKSIKKHNIAMKVGRYINIEWDDAPNDVGITSCWISRFLQNVTQPSKLINNQNQ